MVTTFVRVSACAALALLGALALAPNAALADCYTGNCWGALAAGIYEYSGGAQVSVGSTINADSPAAAISGAINNCQQNGISCSAVGSAFQGCGFITSGQGHGNGRVSWGSGSTAQEAYDRCMSSGGVVCDTQTIGGCNSN